MVVVLERAPGSPVRWFCKCDCGKKFRTAATNLRRGTRHCGCKRAAASARTRTRRVEDRLWARVDKSGPAHPYRPDLGPCWIWMGTRSAEGYGALKAYGKDKRLIRAHRLSFYLAHGRWPNPCALHSCDNPPCVNPAHLFEGTNLDNVRDSIAKHRHISQRSHVGEDNARSKLSVGDVRAIREARTRGVSQRVLAEQYGVSATAIRLVERRRSWRHVDPEVRP